MRSITLPLVKAKKIRFSEQKHFIWEELRIPIPRIYREEANNYALEHGIQSEKTAELPDYHYYEMSMYRARRANNPEVPKSLSEVKITGNYCKTEAGEDFLMSEENNIYIFATG